MGVSNADARTLPASIKAHRLEVAIDLLREVDHRLLRDRFATTPTVAAVVTHRLTMTQQDPFDDDIAELVAEAYETVGPGTSKR